jgi:hypothetical protein
LTQRLSTSPRHELRRATRRQIATQRVRGSRLSARERRLGRIDSGLQFAKALHSAAHNSVIT